MGQASPRFTVTACVLMHHRGRWLLSIRSPEAAYAPGGLGLIGGHLELTETGADALERAARREVGEETGIELTGTVLRYLRSDLFDAGEGVPQLTVTFVAELAGPASPSSTSDELTEVGWWSVEELTGDPRCPPWLPELIGQASRS